MNRWKTFYFRFQKLLVSQRPCYSPCEKPNRPNEKEHRCSAGDVGADDAENSRRAWPLHGYGIARRIEQISGDPLTVNQGTLYPVLLKLEQEGSIASEWGLPRTTGRHAFIG